MTLRSPVWACFPQSLAQERGSPSDHRHSSTSALPSSDEHSRRALGTAISPRLGRSAGLSS